LRKSANASSSRDERIGDIVAISATEAEAWIRNHQHLARQMLDEMQRLSQNDKGEIPQEERMKTPKLSEEQRLATKYPALRTRQR
jgi:hypothetical protein